MEEGTRVGASEWQYFVPYQQDFGQALQELRQQVFASGEFWWYGEGDYLPESMRVPRPTRLENVFDDENVQQSGTHSILDVFRVLAPGDAWEYGSVAPATAEEIHTATGTTHPDRSHAAVLSDTLDRQRWVGRCAVLYGDQGDPSEIVFWGHSGD